MSDAEIRQSLQLELGEGRMRAVISPLVLRPPRGLSASSLQKFLGRLGISHGVERETLEALLRAWKKEEPGPWIVAEGTPASAGRPEGLTRLPPPARSGQDEVELLPLFVKRGDRLFKERASVPPRRGVDVCGGAVEPPPMKAPAELSPGKGIVVEDGVWVARATGFLHAGEGVLRIIKTLLHFHDLGPGTFRWPSDAQITGTIVPGTVLEVGGNLVIEGDIDADVLLHADGDLRIDGAVRGGGTTKISAEGSVQLVEAEGALISGGGDIVVTRELRGCRCRSRGKLIASSERCRILGGTIDAIEGAEVFDVAADEGHRATISVGRASWIAEEMRTVESEIRRWALYHSKLFEDFRKRHGDLAENRSQLWQIAEKKRNAFYADEEEVLAEQQRVDQRISRLRSRLESLAASRAVDAKAVIQVAGTVEGKTALSIRGRRYEYGRKPVEGVTIGIFGDSRRVCAIPTAVFRSSEML